ncbi:MAG: cupin domain-containing protein [Candidatus Binatia bacterium]
MKAGRKNVAELDRLLEDRFLSGLWKIPAGDRPLDPKTAVKPHLWKWADVYDSLLKARDRIGVSDAVNERRTIRLVNPGLQQTEMTSHTMLFAFQLIQPGEVAPAHRHTMAAIRFILQGKGAYTAVESEKIAMGAGDLILTPQWTWHEHAHEGTDAMIWLDGLDVPLIKSLNVISFQPHPDKSGLAKTIYNAGVHSSLTRPVGSVDTVKMPLHYRWEETYSSLEILAQSSGNPYEGVALEYINPVDSGPTLPTLSCWMQMLRPEQRTKVHRHTSTSMYHVFRGSGTTVIDGQPFHWEKGDSFVVPLWSWHEHANRSQAEEALLFSMHDKPVLDAFGLYREEGEGKSHLR